MKRETEKSSAGPAPGTSIVASAISTPGPLRQIVVAGVGNAGCKQAAVVGRQLDHYIDEKWINGDNISLLAINTDTGRWPFPESDKARHSQLGPNTCSGQGTGARPDIAKTAFEESADDLKQLFTGVRYAVVLFAWGGGTGQGAGPEIVKLLKSIGVIVIPVIFEPAKRDVNGMQTKQYEKAQLELEQQNIRIIQPQNQLAVKNKTMSQQAAWDEMTPDIAIGCAALVKTIESLGDPLVDVDLNDVRNILLRGSGSLIAGHTGFADSVGEMVKNLLRNSYYRFGGVHQGAILLLAGEAWTLDQENRLIGSLKKKLDPNDDNDNLRIKVARCSVPDGDPKLNYAILLRADFQDGNENAALPEAWWLNGSLTSQAASIVVAAKTEGLADPSVPQSQYNENSDLMETLTLALSGDKTALQVLGSYDVPLKISESIQSQAVAAVEFLKKNLDALSGDKTLGGLLQEGIAKAYFAQCPLEQEIDIRAERSHPTLGPICKLRSDSGEASLNQVISMANITPLARASAKAVEERKALFRIFGPETVLHFGQPTPAPNLSQASSAGGAQSAVAQ